MFPRLTSVAFKGSSCHISRRAWLSSAGRRGGSSLPSQASTDDEGPPVTPPVTPPPVIAGTIPRGGLGIRVGQSAEVRRSFTADDVASFGRLVGDLNPVHFPPPDDDERKKERERPVVHGMLVSSLFSSVFGTLVPGSVYRSQALRFARPVRVGDGVTGKVDVVEVRAVSSARTGEGVICTCRTTVVRARDGAGGDSSDDEEEVCVSGEARVWLPGASVGREC